MAVVLGIDLGTSSVKALLLDSEKGILDVKAKEYDVSIPQKGYAEQDPQTWWHSALAVLSELRQNRPGAFSEIAAIGFSGQMHGLVVADIKGRPIRPAIVWLDQRSENEVADIAEKISEEEIARIMHNRPFTGFAFPSILWLEKNEPESFKQIYKIMCPKDYLRLKVTGKFGTEASDASSCTGFNLETRNWAFDIIDRMGLPASIFPDCHEGMEIAGAVTRECSGETGIKEGVPVIYGAGDLLCASIGNGIISEGIVLSNIGTGGELAAYIKQDNYDQKLRVHSFCHGIDEAYTIFGATLCSGMSLKWLKNNILGVETFRQMSDLARGIEPASEGLVYLPYLTGERTPHMNPKAKGMFFGLTLGHDRRHFSRAVMEGVTFGLKDSLEVFKTLNIPVKRVVASGGGANCEVWLQMQADIFEKDVQVCKAKEQACLGACIMAGTATGIFESIQSAVDRFVVMGDSIFHPIAENSEKYRKAYEVFTSLYSRNADLFDI